MKLLSKINRRFTLLSIPVLVILLVPVYFIVLNIQENEITESLWSSEGWIKNSMREGKQVSDLYPVIGIRPGGSITKPVIKDTLIFDPVENDFELFRELRTPESVNGIPYEITVRSYGLETSNLAILLFTIFLIVVVLLNITLILLNRQISRSAWRPLSQTISQMQSFSLERLSPIEPLETDTDEFKTLNLEIRKLTGRIISDYQNMKEFTENAAHEWQTPLSVIRSKVDLLLSTPGLNEEQMKLTASVEESIDRLNRLNRGLLQLSKIDNGQYLRFTEINSGEVIREVLSGFAELFEMKSVSVELYPDPLTKMHLDPDLARILFNNLINNALKYTAEGGMMIIKTTCNEITVSNSGTAPIEGGERIFTRFYRGSQSGNSTGLGLALVRSICNAGSISIDYQFVEGFHKFRLTLPAL